jgi:hypothetical protein
MSVVPSRIATEDPFADPHSNDAEPAVSPADTIEYVLSILVSITVILCLLLKTTGSSFTS